MFVCVLCLCVCKCVRACVRARARACVCVCVCWCVCVTDRIGGKQLLYTRRFDLCITCNSVCVCVWGGGGVFDYDKDL